MTPESPEWWQTDNHIDRLLLPFQLLKRKHYLAGLTENQEKNFE
jgi:hypothetical protein